jgi:quinohemoprotein ethanol dehydrogenase
MQLPPAPSHRELIPIYDPEFKRDEGAERRGALYFHRCANCHGFGAIAGGAAPELRASSIILSASAFARIVKQGAFLERGMPRFEELSNVEIEDIRQYLRSRAKDSATK